jgi:ABC-2 type transport system permease protein
MRAIPVIFFKDLRRYLRDRFAILLWLGIPLVIGVLMILASGGADGPQLRAKLLVADHDRSIISRSVVSFLRGNGGDNSIQVELVNEDAGRRRMRHDNVSALLIIPHGFGDSVVAETPTELIVVMNPSQRILPQLVAERLRLIADGAFYLHRVLEPLSLASFTMPSRIGGGFPAIAVVQMFQSTRRNLFPPVIKLRSIEQPTNRNGDATDYPTAFLFLPSVVMLGMLFTAQGLSSDIWRERESGMLSRLATSPVGIAQLLTGKLLAMAAVLVIVASVVLTGGVIYFEIPWSRFGEALVWSVGVGMMLASLMLVAQVFGSTRAGASIVSYAMVMPLMMLGGSMFPLEMMPRWMADIGRYTPNGWGSIHLKAILLGTGDWFETVMALAWVSVLTLALVVGAGRRIKRTVTRR